jgi:hypothetical protein
LESPPAKAVKKKSGKMIEGSSSCGAVVKRWIERQATAPATSAKRLTSATSRVRRALEAPITDSPATPESDAEAEQQRLRSQPKITSERSPSNR